jgi:hypothetical protein
MTADFCVEFIVSRIAAVNFDSPGCKPHEMAAFMASEYVLLISP